MQDAFIQPEASRIPEALVSQILRHTPGAGAVSATPSLVQHYEFSNDLAEVRLDDGRSLIIKRGRHPWSAEGFRTARLASSLLREEADILTPAVLDLPPQLDARPLQAYWRIDRPTLAELWPRLQAAERREAMVSLGRLIRRVHGLGTAGYGKLATTLGRAQSLSQILTEDLGGRLMPAVSAEWPEAAALVELLLEMIPAVVHRTAAEGVVLHGDLHMANVLGNHDGGIVRCVGLLDLECAHAGPPESDLARLAVIQTDLFQMPIEGPWLDWVLEGYADSLDPVVFHFYAIYHLMVLGHHSASIGHDVHAEHVAAAARAAAAGLPSLGTAVSGSAGPQRKAEPNRTPPADASGEEFAERIAGMRRGLHLAAAGSR